MEEKSNMKRMIVFHPALAPYRVDFFNKLDKTFDADFYFTHHNVPDQKFDQTQLKKRLTFIPHYLDSGFDIKGQSIRWGIIGIINKKKPDIIMCSEYSAITLIVFLYKIWAKKNFKLYTISDDSVDNSQKRRGLRVFLRNFISKNISGVIFPSNYVTNWYRNNVSEKTKLLELPIIHDDNKFRKILEESIEMANSNILRYNLRNFKIILFVGRLVEVKNIPVLLDAVSRLKDEEWKLVIIGEGEQENLLKRQAEELDIQNNVVFIGRKEGIELYSWYSLANIFVLPSTSEPFGAVVNEALLGGCFVICSQLAGASSLIYAESGCIFNPYDIDDLVCKLAQSLKTQLPVKNELSNLRANKMPFSFDEKIESLIVNL